VVTTHGLTHIAVAVRDLDRTRGFYARLFGAVEIYRDASFVQLQTPGSRDVLVFEHRPAEAGQFGGILHFGFRLTRPDDIHAAVDAVKAAGGTILQQGEFCPGEPYLFASDPDGYTIEIWYELRTPVDPPDESAAGPSQVDV